MIIDANIYFDAWIRSWPLLLLCWCQRIDLAMCHEWSPACAVQDAASGNDFTARATLSCETTAQGVYHHRMVPGMSWNLLEWYSISMQKTVFDFAGDQVSVLLPLNHHLIATVYNESWPRFGWANRFGGYQTRIWYSMWLPEIAFSLSLHQWLQLLKGLSQLSHLDSLSDIIHRRWRHVASFATVESGCFLRLFSILRGHCANTLHGGSLARKKHQKAILTVMSAIVRRCSVKTQRHVLLKTIFHVNKKLLWFHHPIIPNYVRYP